MFAQSLYHTYRRYRTLKTDKISTLPLVILMPHSACNCRCVMCDIWKGNNHLKQLNEDDINSLLVSLKKLGTQRVLMSGGEALLNPGFFRFCEILQNHRISISLLSTGLSLKKNAKMIVRRVNDLVVSLDGDEETHNQIRNIPNAYGQLSDGVREIKSINAAFRITARSVIHKLNFRRWPGIIESAKQMDLDQTSFLPADVSSHAFNREILWSEQRQLEILPSRDELEELRTVIETVIKEYKSGPDAGFVAESAIRLRRIHQYYAACLNLGPFPYKKCNAPWVSTVVEADGTVRPCFFHPPSGNAREHSLEEIINSRESIRFRRELDMKTNETCVRCVCHLHLSPGTSLNH